MERRLPNGTSMSTKSIIRFTAAAALMGGALSATDSADAASTYVALTGNSITGKVVSTISQSREKANQNGIARCKSVSGERSAPYCQNIKTCGSGWYAYVRIYHSHGWGFGATCGHESEEAAMQKARNLCNEARGRKSCKFEAMRL